MILGKRDKDKDKDKDRDKDRDRDKDKGIKEVVIRTRPTPTTESNITLTRKPIIVDTSKKFTPPELNYNKKLEAFLKLALLESSELNQHFAQYVKAQFLAMEDVRKRGGVTEFVYPELLRLASLVEKELKDAASSLLQITL